VVHSGRTAFGSFRLEMEIPVAYGMRLLFGGGGGESGYAFGELGFKMLVVGTGGPGSWLAHGLFGYGGTSTRSYSVSNSANGPYLGLGLEYRFGKGPGAQ
jgi:hypothetical protein